MRQKKTLDEIKELDKKLDNKNLACEHTNENIFRFTIFRRLGDFIKSIYFDDISLEQAIDKKNQMEYLIRNPKAYKPKQLTK